MRIIKLCNMHPVKRLTPWATSETRALTALCLREESLQPAPLAEAPDVRLSLPSPAAVDPPIYLVVCIF